MLTALANKLSWLFNYRFTLTVCFIVLLPPCILEPIRPGLDPSWKIGLGMASMKGLVFGKDILFTYGPLHFLVTKVGVLYSYKWFIVLFELSAISFVLYLVALVYGKSNHPLRGLLLFLCCFLISDISCEYYVILIFLYACYRVSILGNIKYLYVLALISLLTFLIKINFGFINFFIMFLVFIGLCIKDYKNIFSVLSVSFVVAAIGLLLFHVLNIDLTSYIYGGLWIINDYNDAMVQPFSVTDLIDWEGLVVVGVLVFLIGNNLRFFIQKNHILTSLIFALYGFLIFKIGYVRADNHVYIVVFDLLLFYLLIYLWNSELKYFKQCFITTVLLGFGSFPLGLINHVWLRSDTVFIREQFKEKMNFWGYGLDLFSDLEIKGKLLEHEQALVHVSPPQLSLIAGKSMDVIPCDISIAYEHRLNYNPRPVFQSYSAYGLYLDSLNYKRYVGATAPEYLLFYNMSIDHRVPFWDESVTKRAMLGNYELIDTEPDYDSTFLLLKKRTVPLRDSSLILSSFTSHIYKEIEVPQDTGNVYLFAELQYSSWGKLRRLLFQAPILEIVLFYDNHSQETFRCIPSIMNTGVLINKSVHTNVDAYHFYKGDHGALRRIVKFKILPSSGYEAKIHGSFVKYVPRD